MRARDDQGGAECRNDDCTTCTTCITCADEATAMRVLRLLPDALALAGLDGTEGSEGADGEVREISVAFVDASVGTTVLVHAGEAIAALPEPPRAEGGHGE